MARAEELRSGGIGRVLAMGDWNGKGEIQNWYPGQFWNFYSSVRDAQDLWQTAPNNCRHLQFCYCYNV